MKKDVIKTIIERLRAELELYFRAARAAHAEATHEQSKAENKYDTRGLEASYLARGQSKQAAEIASAIKQFESLAVRSFGPEDPVDVGALVELQTRKERTLYFIGPCAGGTEVVCADREVLVITPQSPLGQQLIGKIRGDRIDVTMAGSQNRYRIVALM